MVEHALQGRKILIVEDEFIIAIELEMIIQDAGGLVIGPARTPQEALNLIEKNAPEFAILDFRLGEENSIGIATRLQALNLPFIVHTGQGDLLELADACPDALVLHKPVPPEVLVSTIVRLLPIPPTVLKIA